MSMWTTVKTKTRKAWNFIKRKWKWFLIATGIVVIATASVIVGNPEVQFVTAEENILSMQDVNFYAENGKLRRVNTDLRQIPEENLWLMDRAPYKATFTATSTPEIVMTYADKELAFDAKKGFLNEQISFIPKSIKWDTGETVKDGTDQVYGRKITNGSEVDGKQGDEANGIIYEDAFGKGINVGVLTHNTVFRKIVKINSLEDLGKIPDKAQFLEVQFELETDYIVDGWNKTSDMEVTEVKRIGDYSYLRQAQAWDSNEETDSAPVKVLFSKKTLGGLYFTKMIPVEFLKKAQFPVYTDTDVAYGNSSIFEAGTTISTKVTEIYTNKFVVCSIDVALDDTGECRVATVSGNEFTWGTSSEFADNLYTLVPLDVCKLDINKFVVVYTDDDLDDDGYARVGTVSGTTISWGTAKEIETGDMENVSCAPLDTDKFVACYNDEDDSDTGKCVACTVSGTTITVGTPVDFAETDYHPNYTQGTAKLDTDKFVNCFYSSDSGKGCCVVGTVDTRTITMGEIAEFEDNTVWFVDATSPDTDKFIVSYDDESGSGDGRSIAATVSTRDITYGTAVAHEDGNTENNENTSIDITHFIVAYSDPDDSGKGKTNYCSVNWTTRAITVGISEQFDTTDTGGGPDDMSLDTALVATDKVVIVYQDDGGTDDGRAIIGTIKDETIANYTYYRDLTVHNEYVEADYSSGLTICASTTLDTFKHTDNGGHVTNLYGDFLFTNADGSTIYDFEIEEYSTTTGKILAWVEIDDAVASSTDETLRVYYGNSDAQDYSHPAATWDSTDNNPVGVWHLSETPTVDSYAYDSTNNSNDGSFFGTMLAEDQVAGQLDGSLDFDGSNDYVYAGRASALDWGSGDGTISAWIWKTAAVAGGTNETVAMHGAGGGGQKRYSFFGVTDGRIQLNIDNNVVSKSVFSSNALFDGVWHHIVGLRDGTDIKMYVDGVLNNTTDLGGGYGSIDDTEGFIIGESNSSGSPGGGTSEWNGLIDDVRIYNYALTEEDITTMYNMEKNNHTFLTWGSEETTAVSERRMFIISQNTLWDKVKNFFRKFI